MIVTFVMQVLVAGALQDMWASINVLQLVVLMPLLEMGMPGATVDLCSLIIGEVTFDIIDSDAITNFLIGE